MRWVESQSYQQESNVFFWSGSRKKNVEFFKEQWIFPTSWYILCRIFKRIQRLFAQMDQIRFRAFWFRTDDSSGTCHRGKWGGRICWCFAINHGLKRKSHTPDPGVYKSGSFFLVGPSPQNGLAWSQVWEIVWPNLWIRSSENWRGVFVGILDFMQNVVNYLVYKCFFCPSLGEKRLSRTGWCSSWSANVHEGLGKFSTKTRGDEQLVGGWACFLGISAWCSKSPSSSISRGLMKFHAFILEAAIPRWFSEKSLHLWSLMQINILDAMTRMRLACFWAYFESHYTDLFFGVSSGWEWLLGEKNRLAVHRIYHLQPKADEFSLSSCSRKTLCANRRLHEKESARSGGKYGRL